MESYIILLAYQIKITHLNFLELAHLVSPFSYKNTEIKNCFTFL